MRVNHHTGPLAFAWQASEGADGCDDDARPWGVTDDEDNLDGCYATEAEAVARADTLNNADEADAEASASEVPFRAVIAVEGFETGDGRVLEPGGWDEDSPRMLPLPMWVQTDQPEWGGHAGAFIGGRMTMLERMADGRRLYAEGFMSTADDRGEWAVEQIRSQNLRFVSIDVGDADVEYEVREVEEDGWPTDVLARFTRYEIMGATVCAAPAIAFAVIWLDGMDEPAEFTAALPDVPEVVTVPEVVESSGPMLLASAGSEPPEEWFLPSDHHGELAELVASTGRAPHLRIIDGSRIVGWVAPFGVCHTAMPGCVTAPHSRTEYAYFATQEALSRCCADCDDQELRRIPAGVLTMDTVHAQRGIGAAEARYHYDHSGFAAARVAVGESPFGIWVAGSLLPGVSEERAAVLNGANLSGDWRLQRGSLELVAALVCNVPGFPMVRPTAHLTAGAGGELVQTALVGALWPHEEELLAAGGQRRSREDPRFAVLDARMRRLEAGLARHESVVDPLRGLAADRIMEHIRG